MRGIFSGILRNSQEHKNYLPFSPAMAFIAVSLAVISAPVEAAETVELRSGQGQATDLANQLYQREISPLRSVDVRTSIIDIQGDGVGELAVQLVSTSTCDGPDNACVMMIAYYDEDQGGWREVLRTYTPTNSFQMVEDPAGSGYKSLIIGDDYSWSWNGDSYVRDLSIVMEQLEFSRTDDWEIKMALVRDADGYYEEEPAFGGPMRLEIAHADMNNDGDLETFVRINHSMVCGSMIGCPIFGYDNFENAPFFRSMSLNPVYLSHDRSGGFRRIVLSNTMGQVAQRWNGVNWEAETTYYDFEHMGN